jgi:MOSC domain-containing protein YiiM
MPDQDVTSGRLAGRVTAVCVVQALLPEPTNPDGVTAIDKRAVDRRVPVRATGLAGDTQCDVDHHGGVDQAVYAYADEDADWWTEHLSREIPAGLFGENLRVSGIPVTDAEIGERWTVGEDGLVLEVVTPRVPCATFQRRMDEEHWVRRFTEYGAPGAYLRVVHEGTVGAGDAVRVDRPGHGVTIGDTFLRPEPGAMRRLLDAEAAGRVSLVDEMRENAERSVARAADQERRAGLTAGDVPPPADDTAPTPGD